MSQEKPRIARLTSMVTLLQSKRVVTARTMANKYQVSLRTIYRDIQTLIASGIPIVTEEGRGYSLMEGYQLPPVLFTESEASALITAQHIMAHNSDTSLTEAYSAALEKIQAVLRYSQKASTELLSQRIQVRNYSDDAASSSYFMKIQAAVTKFQVVFIHYKSVKGTITHREIEPFALIQTQSNWVLIAYCRLRNTFRMFRLDRMQYLEVRSQKFEAHNMSLEAFFEACRTQSYNP